MRLPTPHAAGTDYPGDGGIMRESVLALAERI